MLADARLGRNPPSPRYIEAPIASRFFITTCIVVASSAEGLNSTTSGLTAELLSAPISATLQLSN